MKLATLLLMVIYAKGGTIQALSILVHTEEVLFQLESELEPELEPGLGPELELELELATATEAVPSYSHGNQLAIHLVGHELDHYNAVQQSLITTWSYCSDWSRRLNFNLLLPIWCLFSKVSVIVAIVFGFFCFKKN
ncbi:hypothetical protein EYC80_002274 [Monilinia laxa]|uniref:Uncharacterized protein n=1 Tax=Monilinia laxa TaxID=61186 RepID=A0A5N6K3C7_MONLA|nr:hypothetical protein EYC80_002274 [Monilinia laxa]